MTEDKTEFDSKLLPVLREGVEVVKMLLFIKLKEHVRQKNPAWPQDVQGKIIGAVLNDLFGIVNPEQKFQEFAQENAMQIEEIIADLHSFLGELLIPYTDALRIAVLCDYQEGMGDTSEVLAKAQERGLLLADRDLPMPHRFIELVRKLGSSFGLVVSPVPE